MNKIVIAMCSLYKRISINTAMVLQQWPKKPVSLNSFFCFVTEIKLCGLVAAFALILSMVIYSYIEDIKQSQKRYRAEKEKAEEALALHKQGEREKQIINKDFTEFLVSTTKLNNDHFDMDKGLMIINLAVDKDPENLEAWLRKGYIHFIRHEFEQAYKALEKSQDHSEDVQQLKKMSQRTLEMKVF